MKYGIYFAYWEKEWGVDQKQYIKKVKKLGFDEIVFCDFCFPNSSGYAFDGDKVQA